MSIVSISVSHPGFVRADGVEEIRPGVLSAGGGQHRGVLYGPYVPAAAGVWRVRALAQATGSDGDVMWDVYADARVYAVRHLRGARTAVVRLADTEGLEVRFTLLGAGLEIEGVEIEPLLLDREPASPERLESLATALAFEAGAEAEAVQHLIWRMAQEGAVMEADELREKLRREIPPLEVSPYPLRPDGIARAFDLLNGAGSVDKAGLDHAWSAEEAADFVKDQSFTFVDLVSLAGPAADLLRAKGYRPEFLQATRLHRNLAEPRRAWQTSFGYAGVGEFRPRPAMFEALANTDLSFQTGLARGEGLTAFDPVTGAELKSRHGFVWRFYGLAQTFYRFEGSEIFYVAAGNFPGGRMFIYMPRTEMIALVEEPVLRWYAYDALLREFNAALLQHLPAVDRYLSAETRPAAVCGLNNLGHYFWNEIGGLHWAAERGLLHHMHELIKVPKQYVDAEEVAWELSATLTSRPEEPVNAFRHALKQSLLPIRFSDAQIVPAFAERVRKAAARAAGPNGQPPADGPRPLIWINLRAHNKIWVGQAEGFAKIMNAIYEEYGAAAAYIDGTPDCAEVMVEIRRMTRPEVRLYDGLHVGVFDSLNWAFAIDAYICTVGSGLALVSWLANKPGVAHAEHGHMQQMVWWPYARADLRPPLMPSAADIRDKGEGWYCDYEVDWRILLALLRQALSGWTRPERRGDAGMGTATGS